METEEEHQGDADEEAPTSDPLKAVEVLVSSMELRLRQMITEVTAPSIQKTGQIQADLETLKQIVVDHTRGLQEVQLGQFKALEQVQTISSFHDEMTRWDGQRRQHEAQVDESMMTFEQKLDAFKYNMDQKESVLHQLRRQVERCASELNRMQQNKEDFSERFEDQMEYLSKKVNNSHADIEVAIAGIELKHNALTDALWGEETGLAKVTGELKKSSLHLAQLEESVAKLEKEKAEAAQLEQLRFEIMRSVHQATSSVTTLRQSVGNVVNDVKEHFRTASQTISQTNATFISEVRKDYQTELKLAANLREEVQNFMVRTDDNIATLDTRVADAATKAERLAGEAREEIEDLNKRRKRDKNSVDNELKALKKRLGGVFDNSDAVLRGIEHIYRVIQIIMDAEFMQSSLELQDFVDRKKIALMGYKDEKERFRADAAQPAPEARAKSAPGGPKPQSARGRGVFAERNPQEPVVKVDTRCLSCSGQSPLVMSSFKMACLQYMPSPVEHEGRIHPRDNLLQQRNHLLQRARDELAEGPRHKERQDPPNSSVIERAGLDETAAAADSSTGEQPEARREEGSANRDALAAYAAVEARSGHQRPSGGGYAGGRLPRMTLGAVATAVMG
eukprot:gnl/TRDRNA2_/TRDRNA2_168962_c1_seq1.p1 gnl/TRDRNA2_/TRDRNA2_168962_c1~~gnl/TRDRNA2_/TRDRNA2_168962_c1_seq1.p1  ORF type:complete len:621 (+),score=149.40 gnl/TRDRNA2_/TRDRNA2_168962_c1_seq1:58-1920(+)